MTEKRPTRSLKPGQKPEEKGLRRIAPTRAQDVMQKQLEREAIRPEVVKLPQFPPPAAERPEAMHAEELRRQRIEEREKARRDEILAGLEEDERRRLEQDWEEEDGLAYRPDPADRELEVAEVNAPWAYVQIVVNDRTHEMIYHVIEPKLSHDEKILLQFIEHTLVDVLDLQPEQLEKEGLKDYIRGKFEEVLFDYSIRLGDEESTEEESKERLLYYVFRDFIGEGPIDVLMRDPMIEDISCDGPHVPVFVYHRRHESLTTTVRFRDHDQLDSFVIRMAQRAGKHVSIAEPILDATMRDGSRLQATLAKEVSSFGSTFTIRKFRETPFTPIDLVRFGTMSSAMLAFLWMVIQYRMSAIYAGGTASGKTTAINAIMLFIPPQLKVVTIEDTREINIPQPNWIAGITRHGFGPRDAHGRQAGEIDMFQLLKNALRQRPEYIIVGEVRGAEAYNLFQAMATGHAAYGTMHADSVDAVIHRLESDPINIPRALLEALDVVAVQIQTHVGGKRVRRTNQLTEIVGLDPNTREILTNEVFHWEPSTDKFVYSGVSYSLERIAAESGKTSREVAAEMNDRVRVINWMVDTDLRDYRHVAEVIATYYKDKPTVMKKAERGEPWIHAGREAPTQAATTTEGPAITETVGGREAEARRAAAAPSGQAAPGKPGAPAPGPAPTRPPAGTPPGPRGPPPSGTPGGPPSGPPPGQAGHTPPGAARPAPGGPGGPGSPGSPGSPGGPGGPRDRSGQPRPAQRPQGRDAQRGGGARRAKDRKPPEGGS